MWRGSKVIAWIDTQTHRQTHRHDWKYYLPTYYCKFIPNITKLFKTIWTMEASFSKPLQTTQPIRMQGQQKCCHLLEEKGAYPVRMQDFQTQLIPLQQKQSECRISRHTATQPMSIQDFQTQQKPCITKKRHNADKHYLLELLPFVVNYQINLIDASK